MNKIVTLNALRGNSYSLFRKIPLMINMRVCAFCLVPAMVFAENTHEVTVLNAQQQTRKAVGVVTDKTGEAIIGANVVEKGTTNGTITDLDGKYVMEVSSNATLEFSYIGYMTQLQPVGGKNEINVNLKEDTQKLDEVVVVGYGTQTKREITGSITNVTAEDFNQGLTRNAADLLQGKVAGLMISTGSGQPGSNDVKIRVRGTGSINGSNTPLYILDGVMIEAAQFASLNLRRE